MLPRKGTVRLAIRYGSEEILPAYTLEKLYLVCINLLKFG